MAKRIVDEEMRFSIIINGDKAQKELYDLEKSTRDLTSRNKELRAEQAKLVSSGQKSSTAYKALSAEIRQNNTTIKANKVQMKALQQQIGVTGLTMAQLKKRASELRLQLNNMVPGSGQYKKFQNDLKAVNVQLGKLKNNSRASQFSLGSLANGFNKYAALGASVIATATGVVFSIQKIIDFNGKLSDSQSDVQKTTGLTKEEVDELTKSFGVLETRTSRIDLLKIAEEGGRIGIAKDEIAEFVAIMDKAVVALGDSFPGGVEETASKLGKLKLLFRETKDQGVEEAYNAIGSAINELGANGVATEVNIANFATRVGSLPDALKPSIQDALALGAGFEESGIQAEIAGRAYSILLNQASQETGKFAEVMGLTNDEVAELINNDPLEFMIKFAKGLKGMNATDTAQTLQYLGVQADGANKVLGALSNNTDRFTELLDLSNRSMLEGTSLINEYNIKNNNFAANLDKIGKYLRGAFVNGPIVSGIKSIINGFADLIGVADDLNEAFDKQTKLSVENIRTNRNLAESSRELLEEYEDLKDEGVEPTEKAKRRLDEITLQLKSRFGDSVVEINKETGALMLNTQAVREQIKLKRLAADEEASTLASRLRGAEDEKKRLEGLLPEQQNQTATATRLRDKALKDFNAKKARGEVSLSGIAEIEEVDIAVKSKAALFALNQQIEEQERRRITLLKQLKELNFTQSDIDLMFKTDIDAASVPDLNAGGGTSGGGSFNVPTGGASSSAKARQKSLLDFTRETEDARLELLSDSYQKELELQRVANERKIAELQSQKQTGTADATAINAEINKQIQLQEEINLLKVGAIVEKGIEDRISKMGEGYEKEKAQRQIQLNQQLAAVGNNEAEKERIKAEFDAKELDREEAQLQEILAKIDTIKSSGYFGGINLDLLTPEQLSVFNALADELIAKLSEIGVAKSALGGGGTASDLQAGGSLVAAFESTDIFGFTPDQWSQTFDSLDTTNEKMQAAVTVASALSNAYGQYSDFVNNKTQVELRNFEQAQQKKKDVLSRQLDSGYINQRQYNQSVQSLEQETERRRAEAEYEQAKRNKVQALANIAINTAAAIMGIWAQVPKFDFGISAGLMTAFVGGLGLLQAGMVAATPLPSKGFEDGFYGNMPVQREQDGRIFNASYGGTPSTQLVNKPKLFLAGEQGANFPEMIIDGRSFSKFRPDFKDSLYREIARAKGYEGGYYQNQSSAAPNFNSGQDNSMLLATLSRTNEVLDSLEKNGVSAYLQRSLRVAKDLDEDIQDYKALRNKNKR